ncbi:MAG: non-homologous end-joining DNA ligase [Candidatus Melainabacteria bacterium]|nr:non-homologous end-joining DNA ligase [Candidatus Melainabacteria bacterium]
MAKKTGSAIAEDKLDDFIEQIESAGNAGSLKIDSHTISFSNLNKVLWTGTDVVEPVTKRDYVRYLLQVSNYILPHLHGRPLTLIRYPNGVEGKSFYQKHWKVNKPEFVETIMLFSEHGAGDGEFIQCNNLPTLLWLAQLADLELHTAHTRIDQYPDGKDLPRVFTGSVENIESSLMNHPDFIVLDLDPYMYSGKESKGAEPELHEAGFTKVCEIALALKDNLDKLKMEAFVKTSGRTGLHIYVPIVRNLEYDIVRALAETIGRHLLAQRPNEITMDWAVKKRTGKIFFDHNMNGRGKTLPAPYSPRNSKEATISTPIEWKELEKKLYPTDFTVRTIPDRLKKRGDIWAAILEHKNDLEKIKTKE